MCLIHLSSLSLLVVFRRCTDRSFARCIDVLGVCETLRYVTFYNGGLERDWPLDVSRGVIGWAEATAERVGTCDTIVGKLADAEATPSIHRILAHVRI